jgi:crossover junction endodeoxyribonuclease RusA
MVISIVVPGVPVPQGSKTPWGAESSPHLRGWRAAVAEQAEEQMRERDILQGPVEVQARFVFPRPKKHYRQTKRMIQRELRDDAPVFHTGPPDLDKLQRAIGDALTHIVINDDAQIAKWSTQKQYGAPRAEIRVMLLPTAREA